MQHNIIQLFYFILASCLPTATAAVTVTVTLKPGSHKIGKQSKTCAEFSREYERSSNRGNRKLSVIDRRLMEKVELDWTFPFRLRLSHTVRETR